MPVTKATRGLWPSLWEKGDYRYRRSLINGMGLIISISRFWLKTIIPIF
jgi:hypothetical protein